MNIFKREEKNNENIKEFTLDFPACTFSIPARPTVRQQMEYISASAGAVGKNMVSRFWEGAKVLIVNWKSETLPNFNSDLDALEDPKQTELITWASLQVKAYIDGLENIPKN